MKYQKCSECICSECLDYKSCGYAKCDNCDPEEELEFVFCCHDVTSSNAEMIAKFNRGGKRRLKRIQKITPRKQQMLSCSYLDWYEWYDGWFHCKTDSHQRKNWSRIYKINHRRNKWLVTTMTASLRFSWMQ